MHANRCELDEKTADERPYTQMNPPAEAAGGRN